MNRSTRNSKHPRLNASHSSSTSSITSDTVGRTRGLSPILPKPPVVPVVPPVDFFPEIDSSKDFSSAEFNLPDPLPPLPPSLSKTYNTRKRQASEMATPPVPSAPISPALPTSPAAGSSSKPVTIPGFVSKLYRMVDESTSNLIKWGGDGKTFVVTSPEDFSRQVLPLFFKHNNFSSFVRQLNMYGFHKVPHLQQGSMAASAIGNNESTVWEFSHVSFVRNRPDLLVNVRRKIGKEDGGSASGEISPSLSTLSIDSRISTAEDFIATAKTLRQELQFIHQQQNALRTDLHSLQRDNQLLWNENLASRERHLQQQQVIDRILRFLATVFTADGKLLVGSSGISGIPTNAIGNSKQQQQQQQQQQRPLLLGNMSENEEELRRQVLELISGAGASKAAEIIEEEVDPVANAAKDPSNDFIDFNHRIQDLESTSQDMSKDIALVEDELSNVIKNAKNESEIDDLDFSSYLNCHSLE